MRPKWPVVDIPGQESRLHVRARKPAGDRCERTGCRPHATTSAMALSMNSPARRDHRDRKTTRGPGRKPDSCPPPLPSGPLPGLSHGHAQSPIATAEPRPGIPSARACPGPYSRRVDVAFNPLLELSGTRGDPVGKGTGTCAPEASPCRRPSAGPSCLSLRAIAPIISPGGLIRRSRSAAGQVAKVRSPRAGAGTRPAARDRRNRLHAGRYPP